MLGRPSKYTPELLEAANDYLVNHLNDGDPVPTIAGLAIVLGVRRETLHVWAKEEGKEEFSNTLEQIMAKQERGLVNGGLTGDLNPTIVKLMLANHGYSEKSDVNLGGQGDNPVKTEHTVTFLDG